MKTIGAKHIDYWQRDNYLRRGLKHRFGVRIQSACCCALVQVGGEEPFTFGKQYPIPVDFSVLPSYFRVVIDDEVTTCPSSDLVAVLDGKKSIQAAINSRDIESAERQTEVTGDGRSNLS